MTTLDSLAVSDLPEDHRAALPRPSQQLKGLNQVHELNRLNELHPVTDLAAPALGLLGAIEWRSRSCTDREPRHGPRGGALDTPGDRAEDHGTVT